MSYASGSFGSIWRTADLDIKEGPPSFETTNPSSLTASSTPLTFNEPRWWSLPRPPVMLIETPYPTHIAGTETAGQPCFS